MEGGPPIFRQDFTCPALLKDLTQHVAYGAVTRSGRPFQTVRLYLHKATGLLRVRSPLLAESRLMSFPPGTEMFQFPGFASTTYVFSCRYPIGVGCPIRIPTDQRLLAAPRGFSQRATSFIASWCQGIHRMPFFRSRSPIMRRSHPGPKAQASRSEKNPLHAGTQHTPNDGGVQRASLSTQH